MNNNNNYSNSLNNDKMIIKDEIREPNKNVKNFLNLSLLLGSISFALTGISTYLNINNIMFINSEGILFFPQGATMLFYGSLGILFSINQIIITLTEVGEGFNDFNKNKGIVTIFRKGYPGRNMDVNIIYDINDIVCNKIIIQPT